jgi:hypothetical protein
MHCFERCLTVMSHRALVLRSKRRGVRDSTPRGKSISLAHITQLDAATGRRSRAARYAFVSAHQAPSPLNPANTCLVFSSASLCHLTTELRENLNCTPF